jgi:Fic family protein
MGALRRQWRAASAESSIEIEGFHVPASEQVGVVSGAEPLDPSDENRSVHPFRDGNGRIARIVQSLVLARDGLLAPEFVSIEEYLGRNTDAYYAVLQEVQGGRYQPDRDAGPWVRFCVRAHAEQAHRRLDQIAEAGRRWARLEQLVADRGWPDRLVIALEQSLFHGTDRATYMAEAEVSAPTASNDLRRLLDAELLAQRGRGRTTRYVASDSLRAAVGAPEPAA